MEEKYYVGDVVEILSTETTFISVGNRYYICNAPNTFLNGQDGYYWIWFTYKSEEFRIPIHISKILLYKRTAKNKFIDIFQFLFKEDITLNEFNTSKNYIQIPLKYTP